jgi:hypothetical protein
MFGSEILEVAIGLAFIYLLFSLICSAINEWFARLLDTRARDLEKRITMVLKNPELVKNLYNHPLVKLITRKTWIDRILGVFVKCRKDGRPSTISPQIFSTALSDIFIKSGKNQVKGKSDEDILNTIYRGMKSFRIRETQDQQEGLGVFKIIVDTVKDETTEVKNRIIRVKHNIETWFDISMEQMSKWYKQKTRISIFWIAMFLCGIFNVDTIMIAKHLYYEDATREKLLQASIEYVEKNNSKKELEKALDQNDENIDRSQTDENEKHLKINKLEEDRKEIVKNTKDFKDGVIELGVPIGWKGEGNIWSKIKSIGYLQLIGWIITAFAVSLGSPFWFDLLRKIIGIRKQKN